MLSLKLSGCYSGARCQSISIRIMALPLRSYPSQNSSPPSYSIIPSTSHHHFTTSFQLYQRGKRSPDPPDHIRRHQTSCETSIVLHKLSSNLDSRQQPQHFLTLDNMATTANNLPSNVPREPDRPGVPVRTSSTNYVDAVGQRSDLSCVSCFLPI